MPSKAASAPFSRDDLISRIKNDSRVRLLDILKESEFYEFRSYEKTLADALETRIQALVDDFVGEVSSLRSAEETAAESQKRAKRIRKWLAISLAAICIICFYYGIAAAYIHDTPHTYSLLVPKYRTATSVTFLEVAIWFSLLILTAVVYAVGTAIFRHARNQQDDVDKITERYQVRLQNAVSQELRLLIPSLGLNGANIEFEHTPALVELAEADIVPTAAVRQVEEFVTAHTASALGLSAPRGAGKTTILRHLTRKQEGTVPVYIPAPVRYEPDELLTRIFEDLATEYLGVDWQSSRLRSRYYIALLTSIASFGIGITIFTLGITHYYSKTNLYEWIGVILALASLTFTLYTLIVSFPRFYISPELQIERRRPPANLRRQAHKILLGLRWQQQRTSALSFGSAPWSGVLSASRQNTLMLNERQIGRARLVKEFRDFIRMILSDRFVDRIIIAIDELDKLSNTEDAISVVTELKDILHLEGTHVLVSVSEDVLDRFIARGMPKRDVFDSSFDEIIELPELPAEEAIKILQSRAIGFPRSWAVVCYALSGGIARDLLRYARRCVSLFREDQNREPDDLLKRLINEVGQERVRAVLRANGILARLTEQGQKEIEEISPDGGIEQLERLRTFVTQIDEVGCVPLARWLDWIIEVAQVVIGFNSSDFERILNSASALTKQGSAIWRELAPPFIG